MNESSFKTTQLNKIMLKENRMKPFYYSIFNGFKVS